MERGASHASDTVTELQQEVQRLNRTVSQLTEKCTDLEGRSRRQNLRILNIKEGEEKDRKPRDFIAQLLKDALSLGKLPLIDRAHRVLRSRSDDSHPRAFILKFHYFHEWEDVIRKAAQLKSITFNGQRILIFPDYPPAVVKQRARFNRARELLRDKPEVRYGFQYPACFRITHSGKELYYTNPKEAIEYAERHFRAGNVNVNVNATS